MSEAAWLGQKWWRLQNKEGYNAEKNFYEKLARVFMVFQRIKLLTYLWMVFVLTASSQNLGAREPRKNFFKLGVGQREDH